MTDANTGSMLAEDAASYDGDWQAKIAEQANELSSQQSNIDNLHVQIADQKSEIERLRYIASTSAGKIYAQNDHIKALEAEVERQRKVIKLSGQALASEVVSIALVAYRKELCAARSGAANAYDRDFAQGLINGLDAAVSALSLIHI